MKKFAVVAGVIIGALALIGSFFAGAFLVFADRVGKGDIELKEVEPGELRVKTRGRKYTETKLPEQKHYGF